MPLMFNTLLREASLELSQVRLLRHQDQRATRGRTPCELWRDDRAGFEDYQSTQSCRNRPKLAVPHWAVFVGTPRGETMFVGLYASAYLGVLRHARPRPHSEGQDESGSGDEYQLVLDPRMADFGGKLVIEWGPGARSWIQRADRKNKPVVELRAAFKEPEFPGFLAFREPLSRIEGLPRGWVAALSACGGVYLLTCPRTKEQYVGSATGQQGFWQRWMDYVGNGHGGNEGLKSGDPSDYQVSILEVAGTAANSEDVLRSEGRWQAKLQSQAMGLNRNCAGR